MNLGIWKIGASPELKSLSIQGRHFTPKKQEYNVEAVMQENDAMVYEVGINLDGEYIQFPGYEFAKLGGSFELNEDFIKVKSGNIVQFKPVNCLDPREDLVLPSIRINKNDLTL